MCICFYQNSYIIESIIEASVSDSINKMFGIALQYHTSYCLSFVANNTPLFLMSCHKVTRAVKGQKTAAFCPQIRGFILFPDENQSLITIGQVTGSVGFL